MAKKERLDNLEKLVDWAKAAEFTAGGLMYVGFSKRQTNKLLCISSQDVSLVNCDTGDITRCAADYDENELIAVCTAQPDEMIDIYGAHGGCPIRKNAAGEYFLVHEYKQSLGKKTIVKVKVSFCSPNGAVEIFHDYGFYTCSFSPCGNYAVFAEDTGVVILKREHPAS